MGAN